jgi:two-component system phosphate regulon sensor histidine kinase PhoR
VDKDNSSDLDDLFFKIEKVLENKINEITRLHNRDDFRKEFLGNVSHELKTPLFTAQGYILTLLEGEISDKKQRQKYLKKAAQNVERLNFIVKDLDMISKLETGMNLKFETFNIVKLINEVFDMLEIKAGKKNITLTFDKQYKYPLFVNADMKRIEQVLINLISNSINYGKIKGTTTLVIKSFQKDKFIIKVKDDGIGIEQKDLPRLFERFYRVDKSRSRKQGGSGLGLSIVKHIVEAHKQQIFVKSKKGSGSEFSFTLNKLM